MLPLLSTGCGRKQYARGKLLSVRGSERYTGRGQWTIEKRRCGRRRPMKGLAGVSVAVVFLAVSATVCTATVYEVGPGKAYENIRDVPWEAIDAGDTVNIYYREAPYAEKFNVSAIGTEAKPVTVHGVPNAEGKLPVIDGDKAVTRTQMTYPSDERAVINVGRANNAKHCPFGSESEYIVIENLEVMNGTDGKSYTSDDGTTRTYAGGHGIYVCLAEHVTIRNCVLRDNTEGYFFSSNEKYGWTGAMVVEGCHIYNNGTVGSDLVHGSYCESIGLTCQYNHYGPNLQGCEGSALKDRSAGTVIRYNWIEDGFWNIDLVDGDGSSKLANDPSYGGAFVYGNILVKTDKAAGHRMLHWGGDGENKARYRSKQLEFYNNTFVDRAEGNDTTELFQGSVGCNAPVHAYNNIFFSASGVMHAAYRTGVVKLSHNWLSTGFKGADGGTAEDDGTNLTGKAPGFVDYAKEDYHLAAGSPCIDAGMALPAVDLPGNNLVREYAKHQGSVERRSDGHIDIGAYEYRRGGAGVVVETTGVRVETTGARD
jgi:hypothetical protein